ncbi:MAG: gluconate transporter [Hyphomonadaceae bacterium]|nr:gluconate transporter [Hyphomonadaceae bacterium]
MEILANYQAVWATLVGLFVLMVLILRFKTNAFISLLGCAILTGLIGGMAPDAAFKSVQNGMGGTLGFIAPIIGLGAIFGAILERSDALAALADRVNRVKGGRAKTFATGSLGLIAATPVFFDVALIILLPLVMRLAQEAKKVPLYFGLPLCAGLAIGHAFIPPTPGPIIIATYLQAGLGHVILVGACVSVVSLIIAGPLFTNWLDGKNLLPGKVPLIDAVQPKKTSKPAISFSLALLLMLFPIVLIPAANVAKVFFPENAATPFILIVGHPFSALILACILSWIVIGPKTPANKASFSEGIAKAFEPTALIILVTGAGGAFKQVLTDSGAGNDLAALLFGTGITPVILGFVLALVFRLLQGSATVAMTAAAGLMASLIGVGEFTQWQLAILTISIAAGASGFSHVNDSGFWLVNRLFDLTEKETLRTWTLMTGLLSVSALAMCVVLYGFTG